MFRSLYLLLIYFSFIAAGTVAPFVFSLGYVWVDIFRPQEVAYTILPMIPVSMIMGVLALGGYVLLDRRSPPPVTVTLILTLLFAVWITITTAFLAVAPGSVWAKWDWAFKTVVFSAFIPFVFRSRVQIEAFLQVYLFALAIHILPTGLKTIVSGGGYGRTLGVISGNAGFGEGSTLAAVAVMTIPIALYLWRHTLLMPKLPAVNLLYIGVIGVALFCAIGTYARTGLVGMVVVGTVMWLRSRHKIGFGILAVLVAIGLGFATSDAWNQRISTIDDYKTENSALGRVLVWKWTLDFVATNPFGGGFNSYEINEIVFPSPDGASEGTLVRGKAFHSIYFEVLGEHGWPGFALFIGLIVTTLLSLQRTLRWARRIDGMAWLADLALALQTSLVTLLACGAFVGIAFQPMLYYIFAMGACLAHHARRVRQEMADGAGARPRQPATTHAPPATDRPAAAGWRSRYDSAPVMATGHLNGWRSKPIQHAAGKN